MALRGGVHHSRAGVGIIHRMNDETPDGPLLEGIDLNLLRALHALLREDSISRAAQALGISQAAASNALRRLRAHFHDDLRVRRGSRMAWTPLAQSLRPLAAAAMWSAARVLDEPRSFAPHLAVGTWRVATSDHVDAVLLESFTRQLAPRAPGLRLQVEPFVASSGERLLLGALDLVLAPRAALPEGIRAARLFEEPYVVVVRRGHPAARHTLSVDRFASLAHIAVSPAGGTRFAVDTALAALGKARAVSRVVPSFSQALLLVSVSDAAAVLPRSFAERFAAQLRLALLPVPLHLPPVRVDMGWAPSRQGEPLHLWMRGQLRELAHQRYPSPSTR